MGTWLKLLRSSALCVVVRSEPKQHGWRAGITAPHCVQGLHRLLNGIQHALRQAGKSVTQQRPAIMADMSFGEKRKGAPRGEFTYSSTMLVSEAKIFKGTVVRRLALKRLRCTGKCNRSAVLAFTKHHTTLIWQ
jgi:hypothetical protein